MSKTKVFGTPYAHKRYGDYTPTQPSLTQQQFKSDTDINTIVAKMQKGEFLQTQSKQPAYGQTFRPNQYEEAIQVVRQAQNEFNALPSHIRERFKNDPSRLVEFVQNVDNTDEAIKLGLVDINKFSSEKLEFINSDVYQSGKMTFKDFYNGNYKKYQIDKKNLLDSFSQASTVTTGTSVVVNEPATH